MFRGVSKSISKPLCILMNRSFDKELFPNIWKVASVTPIDRVWHKGLLFKLRQNDIEGNILD